MTAVEYVKKERALQALPPFIIIFGALCGAILTVAINFAFKLHGAAVSLGFLLPLAGMGLGVLVAFKPGDRFARQHPEMEHLDEWVAIMGSAETYPLAISGFGVRHPTSQDIFERLCRSAERANIAFDMSVAIAKLMEETEFLPKSTARVLIESAHEDLVEQAEYEDGLYVRAWELFVNKTQILPKSSFADPKIFRESIRHQS